MKMLYFAWVRDVIGLESEEIELPQNVKTAGQLLEWLKKIEFSMELQFGRVIKSLA